MFINFFLYTVTILIWGSTWLAIHWQLGVVSPYWSVTYRFAIATTVLMLYCICSGKKMRFNYRQHMALAAQGALLFSLNYLLYYLGSQYFMSGLVAVTFASIVIMNILNSRIFLKTPLQTMMIIGSIIGLLGLCVIFYGQFQFLMSYPQWPLRHLLTGLAICLTATLTASLGNILFVYNQRFHIPIVQNNAYAMLYGTILLAIVAISLREPLSFDPHLRYWASLLYLALVGSVIAFGSYLQLVNRVGAERSAYAFVVLPVVSLFLSGIFEHFYWTLSTFVGLLMIVLGNVLVIKRKKT